MSDPTLIRTSGHVLLNMKYIKSLEITQTFPACIVAIDDDRKVHKVSQHNSRKEAEEQIDRICKFHDIYKFYNYNYKKENENE